MCSAVSRSVAFGVLALAASPVAAGSETLSIARSDAVPLDFSAHGSATESLQLLDWTACSHGIVALQTDQASGDVSLFLLPFQSAAGTGRRVVPLPDAVSSFGRLTISEPGHAATGNDLLLTRSGWQIEQGGLREGVQVDVFLPSDGTASFGPIQTMSLMVQRPDLGDRGPCWQRAILATSLC